MKFKIVAVVVARNEEVHIGKTIASLKNQTVEISRIIVVDDGSIDATGEIASMLGTTVIRLPYHEQSFVGRPELAERWNAGLAKIEDADFVLLLGADHVLPSDYVQRLLEKMNENPKLVVASGRIEGEPFSESAPRGSGRLVRCSFWKEVNNAQYPVGWGWEGWLPLKAMQLGFEARCFDDIVTKIDRATSFRKAEYLGKGMYALGYDWKYALARCLITFVCSPRAGLEMFWGWLGHKDVKRLDVADWVNKTQRKRFWKRVWQVIKRGGRR